MSPHLTKPLSEPSSNSSVLLDQLLSVQFILVQASPERGEDFHSYISVNPFASGSLPLQPSAPGLRLPRWSHLLRRGLAPQDGILGEQQAALA